MLFTVDPFVVAVVGRGRGPLMISSRDGLYVGSGVGLSRSPGFTVSSDSLPAGRPVPPGCSLYPVNELVGLPVGGLTVKSRARARKVH